MLKLWKRFTAWLAHVYVEGLTGELCWECSGLKKKLQEDAPKIRAMQRHYIQSNDPNPRYGCPQDYDNAQDFIDRL